MKETTYHVVETDAHGRESGAYEYVAFGKPLDDKGKAAFMAALAKAKGEAWKNEWNLAQIVMAALRDDSMDIYAGRIADPIEDVTF